MKAQTVTIEKHDGRLRLRWAYQGERYTLAVCVPDSPTGKAIANQKKAQIVLDIQAGSFDETLLKYKPCSGQNSSGNFHRCKICQAH